MNPGIQIHYEEYDDPPKMWVTASNGIFHGVTEDYVSYRSVKSLVNELSCFPIDKDHIISFGTRSENRSHIAINFELQDSLGHGLATVSIANGFYTRHRSEAIIAIDFEMSALDEFQKSLAYAFERKEGDAFLKGIEAK